MIDKSSMNGTTAPLRIPRVQAQITTFLSKTRGDTKSAVETSSRDRVENLRSIPLFADLSDAALERILECATEFEVRKEHVLVQPNQPGAGLFIIEDGTVAVELRDRTIERGQGEFFGELALLDEGGLRSARVRTLTPARCLAISRDDFNRLLEDDHQMTLALLRALARRLVG
jgi:CRP/FNR family cyclic AMP-dependent transcriptional regulator